MSIIIVLFYSFFMSKVFNYFWKPSKKRTRAEKPVCVLLRIRLLVDDILKSLTCLEGGSLASSDLYGLAGAGILTGSLAANAGLKGTEADELDLVALNECSLDCCEGSLNCCLSVLLGEISLCCNCFYELCLVHNYNSFLFLDPD